MRASAKVVILSIGQTKKGIPYFKAFDMEANRILNVFCPDYDLSDIQIGVPCLCDFEGAIFSGGFWANSFVIRKS